MDAVVPPRCLGCGGMSDLARSFNDVAEAYDFGRPRYDAHAIDAIAAAAGGGPRLLDLGAGTGRLSAPAAGEGLRRRRGRAAGRDARHPDRRRSAPIARWPDTPRRCRCPMRAWTAPCAADAWHWFDGARAADELARVVRPGGGVVVCVTYPRWYGSDDAPDWWLDLTVVHTALPKADHPALVSGWRRTRRLRASSGLRGDGDARGALRAPHRPRADRRALGIDVVRRGAARGSARRFPRRARRDARAARRSRRSTSRTGPSCGSLGAGQAERASRSRRAA